MSGHSKWQTIKRKKGAQDAKRGQEFTKLSNAIAVAAREGEDPETNFRLRLAIDKAKQANMPNSNIEKAVARGSGKDGSAQVEDFLYEGYGPGGVAVIVEGVTDNRNRAASTIRTAFNKNGGNMADTGAVSFQFDRRGIITIETSDVDEITLAAIDAGAEDVFDEDGVLTVYTDPKQLKQVQQQLQDYNVKSADLGYVPHNIIKIEDVATAKKVVNLMDVLEDIDDVTATYTNFDVDDSISAELA